MIGGMAFFVWLRDSGFSMWIRESGSIWSYPTVLFLHTLGLAIVVGFNSALDLRILGVAPRAPGLIKGRAGPGAARVASPPHSPPRSGRASPV